MFRMTIIKFAVFSNCSKLVSIYDIAMALRPCIGSLPWVFPQDHNKSTLDSLGYFFWGGRQSFSLIPTKLAGLLCRKMGRLWNIVLKIIMLNNYCMFSERYLWGQSVITIRFLAFCRCWNGAQWPEKVPLDKWWKWHDWIRKSDVGMEPRLAVLRLPFCLSVPQFFRYSKHLHDLCIHLCIY